MSRSIQNIKDSILSAIASDPVLASINSPSDTAIWKKWVDVISTAIATEENLNDIFITNTESILKQNAPATIQWIQKMLNYFQYSLTTPQAIQLNTTNLAPYYVTEDTSLNIITRNAIVTSYMDSSGHIVGTPGIVLVKVAKGTTPGPLNSLEIAALQSYLNIIKPAGILYQILSVKGDRLFTEVKVWYNGAYSSTIQNSVLAAYNNYLATLPFNGVLKLSDLMIAIKNVTGVSDVEFVNINYRRGADSFVLGTNNIVDNYTELHPTSNFGLFPYAGFVVDEDTTGYDFLSINASNFISI